MSVLSQEIEWSCIFGLGVSTVSLFLRIICPVYDSRGGGYNFSVCQFVRLVSLYECNFSEVVGSIVFNCGRMIGHDA